MASFPASRVGRALLAAALLAAVALALGALAGRTRRPRADFAFTCGGEVRSLDPQAASGVPEARMARMLFEGLLTRDPRTLAPMPGVAERWEQSADGLTFTFHLRESARWSNGDPVTAEDFEWSFQRLLARDSGAGSAAELWCVAGAREFNTGRSASGKPVKGPWKHVGIRALDPRTLQFELDHPTARFLDVLALHALAPVHRRSLEEMQTRFPDTWASEWTKPEHLVCNGPFRLLERRLNDRLRFAKNEAYWDAEHVAMRTVDALAIESWNSALNLYLTGELDWVDGAIPTNLVPKLLGREDFQPQPYYGVYFYRVNVTRPPLDDARVRRALSKALLRAEICNKILKAGQAPAATFVPWTNLGGYKSPPGVNENVDDARTELVKSGHWRDGRAVDLRPLEIHYNSSEVHRDIAEVAAAQWRKRLDLEVKLRNQEWKAFLDAQSTLQYDLSRSSWIADYADASNFLEIWVSGGENNRTGWSNATYDKLIETARVTADFTQRNELYRRAEQILLEESPCIPIYGYVTQNLLDPRLGGFPPSTLNEVSPKGWYWMDEAELKQERAQRKGKRVDSHGPPHGLYAPAAQRPEPAK